VVRRHHGKSNRRVGFSSHGFKHGPAVGEYMAARILEGGAVETRFSLATKEKLQRRAVY
jgi:glycine/D-amino acid oxidase-like deaminating enzyme